MRLGNLETAIKEANRFLERADDLMVSEQVRADQRGCGVKPNDSTASGALAAAVKRASMTLTKALAKLRREA